MSRNERPNNALRIAAANMPTTAAVSLSELSAVLADTSHGMTIVTTVLNTQGEDDALHCDLKALRVALRADPALPRKGKFVSGTLLERLCAAKPADCASAMAHATTSVEQARIKWGRTVELDLDAASHSMMAAAPRTDIRYYMSTLVIDPQRGRIVGCDGHRLHVATQAAAWAEIGKGMEGFDPFLLPEAAARVLLACGESRMTVQFGHGADGRTRWMLAAFGADGVLLAREVEGKYPDIDRVTPDDKRLGVRLSLDTELCLPQLREGLRRAKLADSKATGCVIEYLSEHAGITVRFGADQEPVRLAGSMFTRYEGTRFRVSCQARYLIDALTMSEGQVEVWLANVASAESIRLSAHGHVAVVMPLRMGDDEIASFPEAKKAA